MNYYVYTTTAKKAHIAEYDDDKQMFFSLCDAYIGERSVSNIVLREPNVDELCGICRMKRHAKRVTEIRRYIKWLLDFGPKSSNDDGYCRHGVYVGGSGADYMCGVCETMSHGEELKEMQKMLADELKEAR